MKHLLTFICLLFAASCFSQNATQKPYFEYNDTVFYVGQKAIRWNIYFDLSKPTIIPSCTPMVDSLVDFMIRNPKLKLEIGVHSDGRTTNRASELLTPKRAQYLKDYLVYKGVAENRLTAVGYEKSTLLNHCTNGVKCTEEEHQVNRRVEFKILSTE